MKSIHHWMTSSAILLGGAGAGSVARADDDPPSTPSTPTRPDQVGLQVGVSGGIAFPFIGFSNDATGAASITGEVDMGGGATLHANYFLNEWFAVGVNAGFFHFPGSDTGLFSSPSINIVPVTLSLGLFPNFGGDETDLRPQFGVDLGMYVLTSSAEGVAAEADFGFALVLGSGVAVADNVKIFGNAKPHFILSSNSEFGFISYLDVVLGVMVTLP